MKSYYIIHKKVIEKSKLYKRWHENKYHNPIHMISLFLASFFALLIIAQAAYQPVEAQAQMVIDGNQTFQVIDGIGATVGEGWNNWGNISQQEVADVAVNELGLSVARLGFPSQVVEGGDRIITDGQGNRVPFKNNDNEDSNVADMQKFHDWIDDDQRFYQDFIQAIVDAGLNRFELTMWSPALWLKTSNPDRNIYEPVTSSNQGHLYMGNTAELCEHVATVIKDLQNRGINISWFSPVNEPDVGPTYEDCSTLRNIIDMFESCFSQRGINIEIVGPETAGCGLSSWATCLNDGRQRIDYATFHQYPPSFTDPGKGGWNLDDPNYVWSEDYVGQLKNVGFLPMKKMQTEFSNFYAAGGNVSLQDTYEEGFLTAWHMHQGFTLANFNIWMWWNLEKNWQSHDPSAAGYYENGAGQRLIWLDTDTDSYTKTPKYWAFRMFSRFVRPGMVRVGVNNIPIPLRVSAFTDHLGETTIVILNTSSNPQDIPRINFQNLNPNTGFYRYSYTQPGNGNGKSMQRIQLTNSVLIDNIQIPGRSIFTYSTIDDGLPPALITGCDNDGNCGTGENFASCPNDCPASCDNDGNCDTNQGESLTNCPNDCQVIAPFCGNANCDSGENSTNCPQDCVSSNQGASSNQIILADFNCDAQVNIKDFGILLSHWGQTENLDNYQHPLCSSLKSLNLSQTPDPISQSQIINASDIGSLLSCWGTPSNQNCFE